MKQCGKCRKLLNANEFYKNKAKPQGLDSYCKNCTRLAIRERYRKNPEIYQAKAKRDYERRKKTILEKRKEYREKNKDKFLARKAVEKAIANGKLIKQPCEKCNSSKNIVAHHHDYNKLLDIQWLCNRCHMRHHAGK